MYESHARRNDPREALSVAQSALLRRATAELEHVHRQELARLFRQAAAIAVQCRVDAQRCHPLLAPPRRTPSLRVWKTRVGHALEWEARREAPAGATALSSRVLARLAQRPPERWPGPTLLVRCGLRLGATEALRIDLGFALLCDDAPERARRVFRALLEDFKSPLRPWLIFEGLSFAAFMVGDHPRACVTIERAADDRRCCVSTLVYALVFALLAGGVADFRRAAARLELQVDDTAPEFLAAYARIDRWVRSDPQPRWRGAAHLFGNEQDVRSPVGRVVLRVLEVLS